MHFFVYAHFAFVTSDYFNEYFHPGLQLRLHFFNFLYIVKSPMFYCLKNRWFYEMLLFFYFVLFF